MMTFPFNNAAKVQLPEAITCHDWRAQILTVRPLTPTILHLKKKKNSNFFFFLYLRISSNLAWRSTSRTAAGFLGWWWRRTGRARRGGGGGCLSRTFLSCWFRGNRSGGRSSYRLRAWRWSERDDTGDIR